MYKHIWLLVCYFREIYMIPITCQLYKWKKKQDTGMSKLYWQVTKLCSPHMYLVIRLTRVGISYMKWWKLVPYYMILFFLVYDTFYLPQQQQQQQQQHPPTHPFPSRPSLVGWWNGRKTRKLIYESSELLFWMTCLLFYIVNSSSVCSRSVLRWEKIF